MKRRLKVAGLLLAIAALLIILCVLFEASYLWYLPGIATGIFALAYVSGDAGADTSGLGKTGDGSGGLT
ncbi:hypothetical protein [Cognatiyoonia sp. IB215182]|uniref:hypothetical protein n=1 Tax=Cognatiyoonia sp. IB215182 TaxID=3097353 RepID=UPI002A1688BF|nr:hypothetical protein [Cognatiyoonia sp. IB215182]MDX8351880.1 hypothetical protein [Cognatiyoonia sp. IB215182]